MIPAAVAAMAEWRVNPVAFVREVLRAVPDEWQVEVLHAVASNQRVALKASKGPGKTTGLAWVGWWFLCTRPHAKVVCTSVTGDNLRDGMWSELARWRNGSELLKATFTWAAERITCNESPETWWASARTWPKSGDASQQADTLAGVHADHVLFLIDEAGGIPDAVVAAAEGGLANADESAGREAKLVLAGNPTHLSGPLYRACTRERHLWWVKEISGDPDDPKRAPRVNIKWAREQIEKYGRDSAWVLVNVFGQFPPGQSNALLGVEEVAAASRRSAVEVLYVDEPRVLGVDVARMGDDRSVFFLRQGPIAFRPKVFRELDTMATADQVAFFVSRNPVDAIFIDMGGVGAGVYDRCKQLGLNVIGIDFGGNALDKQRYANRRAEMWLKMADWVKSRGCIPADAELMGELTAPTYHFDKHGRHLIESKDEIKERLGKSPDIADGLALTFAAPVQRLAAGERRGVGKAKTEYEAYAS